MPLITDSLDSLPYLDNSTPESLASARALISASLPPSSTTSPHPSLPSPPPSLLAGKYRPTATSAPNPLSSIKTSHYESPSTLREACISSFYLGKRQQTLELLEQFGKNSWLVHNSVLEDELRALEKELVQCREETTGVNRERKQLQVGAKEEMEGLEREWRRGVGRVVEVEVGLGELEMERVRLLREGGH